MSSPKIRFPAYDEEGNETQAELPAKYEVCDRCRGEGVHDHPAFSNGISREDFDEDPDFGEDYRAGAYDVTCTECKGQRVVAVVDEDRCDPKLLEQYWEHRKYERDYKRERDAERRMGA